MHKVDSLILEKKKAGTMVMCLASASAAALAADPAEVARYALADYQPPTTTTAATWPDDRLSRWTAELIEFVYQHHIVTDQTRAVYGMGYEFWQNGRQMQTFTLDAMHDTSWFMSALVTAHRLEPKRGYLDRALQYHAGFFTHTINHSDVLFKTARSHEDKRELDRPMKGWVPRGWDDGQGYERGSDRRIPPGHSTPSNHLAIDLADSFLNVWMSTRASALGESLEHIHRYRREYFGRMPEIEYVIGVLNGPEALADEVALPKFTPASLYPVYEGMFEKQVRPLTMFDDPLAYEYRRATCEFVRKGQIPASFLHHAAARVYGHGLGMQYYFDQEAWPSGLYFFDIQPQPKFIAGQGKLDEYASVGKKIYGARGIQITWIAAGILPALARQPELWESYHRQYHADEPRVRVVDASPATDGKLDAAYDNSCKLEWDDTVVWLLATPKHLHLLIESNRQHVKLRLRQVGDVQTDNHHGEIEITATGLVKAVNHQGDDLLFRHAQVKGERWSSELRIPFSVVHGQQPWINGVENGRYEITLNNGPARVVYMLSEGKRIVERLEAMVLGTLQTWFDVWEELGVIPSGYRSRGLKVAGWEISDLGNYAHLIKTISLWRMYQHGRSEWELITQQWPEVAQPIPVLPEESLRAKDRLR